MLPVIAQLSPDTLQIAGGMASVFFLVGGINAILKLADRVRGQPSVEQLKVVTDALHQRVRALEVLRERDHKDQAERRAALYQHVEKTRLELKQDLKALDAKIGAMPAEIVALLRNTGALS